MLFVLCDKLIRRRRGNMIIFQWRSRFSKSDSRFL